MSRGSCRNDLVDRGAADSQSLDTVLDLVADPRRRFALECLSDHSEAIALADLAEDIAVREAERSITEIPKETVKAIRLTLHHQHLPKLTEAGAADYDQDRKLVRLSESTAMVEWVLSITGDRGDER